MPFITFDTETTGMEPGSRLLEIAIQRCANDGTVLETLQALCNPGMPLPPDALAVNRISAEDLANAAPLREVMEQARALLNGADFAIAHFAPFDVGIISYHLGMVGLDLPVVAVVDTCEIAKARKATSNNKLATLVEHHGITMLGDSHRALADADACRQYWNLTKEEAAKWGKPWAPSYRWTDPRVIEGPLEDIDLMISEARPLHFTYVDAKGNRSNRKITPYGFAQTDTGLSFHGLCHEKGERRTFLAERIVL